MIDHKGLGAKAKFVQVMKIRDFVIDEDEQSALSKAYWPERRDLSFLKKSALTIDGLFPCRDSRNSDRRVWKLKAKPLRTVVTQSH